jgi:hypothetical protein
MTPSLISSVLALTIYSYLVLPLRSYFPPLKFAGQTCLRPSPKFIQSPWLPDISSATLLHIRLSKTAVHN